MPSADINLQPGLQVCIKTAQDRVAELVRVVKPEKLQCPRCAPEEYHRLSVADGLAHWELGEIWNESQIDDMEINPRPKRERAVFVGKEFARGSHH